jgi:hypothetical protein
MMSKSNDHDPILLIPVIDPTDFMEAYGCGCLGCCGQGSGGGCGCGDTNGKGSGEDD